ADNYHPGSDHQYRQHHGDAHQFGGEVPAKGSGSLHCYRSHSVLLAVRWTKRSWRGRAPTSSPASLAESSISGSRSPYTATDLVDPNDLSPRISSPAVTRLTSRAGPITVAPRASSASFSSCITRRPWAMITTSCSRRLTPSTRWAETTNMRG